MKKEIICGLAFFPVVAISSNLSTSLIAAKEIKKNGITKLSVCSQMSENLLKVIFIFLK